MAELEGAVAQVAGTGLIAKVVVALVLVAAIAVVSHFVVRSLRHFMRKDDNPLPQSSIFVNITRGVIWGLGLCFVLDSCFGVNMSALVAALGVGGIAVSLGFQDTLSNLIGGTQISFMKIVQPGDNIQVGTSKGVVQDVTWRHTTVKNRLGETVIIPNSVISKNAVVHLPPPERLSVPFVLPAATDLDDVADRAAAAAREAALEFGGIVKEPVVLFTEVTDTGVLGKVVIEIEDAAQATPASDAITRAIAPIVRG